MSGWGGILCLSGKGKNDIASKSGQNVAHCNSSNTKRNGKLSFVPLNIFYMYSIRLMEKTLEDQGLISS